jgi:hypothetical protein
MPHEVEVTSSNPPLPSLVWTRQKKKIQIDELLLNTILAPQHQSPDQFSQELQQSTQTVHADYHAQGLLSTSTIKFQILSENQHV